MKVNEHFESDLNAAMRPSAFCNTVQLSASQQSFLFITYAK